MTRWSDIMGLEDPAAIGNDNVIAQVVLEQLGVPAGGRAAAVASWRSDGGRGGRSGARAGRRRRCPGHCFQCPGGDHRGADRRGRGLRTVRRRHRRQLGRQDAGPPIGPTGGRGRDRLQRTGGRHAGRARCPTGPGRPGMAAVWGRAGAGPGRAGGEPNGWNLASAGRHRMTNWPTAYDKGQEIGIGAASPRRRGILCPRTRDGPHTTGCFSPSNPGIMRHAVSGRIRGR